MPAIISRDFCLLSKRPGPVDFSPGAQRAFCSQIASAGHFGGDQGEAGRQASGQRPRENARLREAAVDAVRFEPLCPSLLSASSHSALPPLGAGSSFRPSRCKAPTMTMSSRSACAVCLARVTYCQPPHPGSLWLGCSLPLQRAVIVEEIRQKYKQNRQAGSTAGWALVKPRRAGSSNHVSRRRSVPLRGEGWQRGRQGRRQRQSQGPVAAHQIRRPHFRFVLDSCVA